MNQFKKFYKDENWLAFSNKIKQRDNYTCLKCGRKQGDIVLQTHHKVYKSGVKLWEYPYSDCISLCSGCHAREHNVIEPSKGWSLISVDDLGGLYGICELKGCNNDIRYEHLIYHPLSGYKVVGSTCVEYLTEEDIYLSSNILKSLKKISEIANKANWNIGYTKKGVKYYFTKYNYNEIRIYENYENYSFQINLKIKGVRWLEFGKFIKTKNKKLNEVKELAYIVLLGTISKYEHEKNILRNIYKNSI